MADASVVAEPAAREGTPGEVLRVFLKLGLTSFGGPIAHLAYFRRELVERRRWLSEQDYGDLVALCQFLPGPASSQVGFTIGLMRGGALGALAAFAAFTLPSAVLMVAFASGAALLDGPVAAAVLGGLQVAAVAVVASAVLGMARTLVPDGRRAAIAVVAAAAALLLAGSWGQVTAIAIGALAGAAFCRRVAPAAVGALAVRLPRAVGIGALVLLALLLVVPPALAAATDWGAMRVFSAFLRAGALVFGGGHVVLPLLQADVVGPGWVAQGRFLEGYAAAQAVPGPLFTFAGFLGVELDVEPNGVPGAAIALAGIFLPGLLLVVGVLPFWHALRIRPGVRALMAGANAAVVGILGAALYDPVFVDAVTSPPRFVLALGCFALLVAGRAPSWAVVLVGAAGGLLIGLL